LNDVNQRLSTAKGILFDLDNTLYPREKGVFNHINEKITEYVRWATGREGTEADALRKDYKERYGTTLGGLMRHDSVNIGDYLDFVHDVPVEELLEPDPALAGLLGSIELPMVIFTNGTHVHAGRVLDALRVAPCFEGICDLADTDYIGKPYREAFDCAAGLLGIGLDEAIFVDDLSVNVEAGSEYCAFTIHVGPGEDGVGDLHVENVLDLGPVFAGMPWYRGQG
jgi:putative hydrolase of the HAD superfamily